tara:strand:+ start:132 stop:356 length:225 start_codon:yes stop_codon:yes gene_type:complete
MVVGKVQEVGIEVLVGADQAVVDFVDREVVISEARNLKAIGIKDAEALTAILEIEMEDRNVVQAQIDQDIEVVN